MRESLTSGQGGARSGQFFSRDCATLGRDTRATRATPVGATQGEQAMPLDKEALKSLALQFARQQEACLAKPAGAQLPVVAGT